MLCWLTITLRLFQQHPGDLCHKDDARAQTVSRSAAYTIRGQDAGRVHSAAVLSVEAALFK